MSNYQELLKQREVLEAQIQEARRAELATALQTVHALIRQFQLTEQEVFPPLRTRAAGANAGTKVAPKYRDPATGQTWTGRGKAPKWIQGQDRTPFAI